MTEEERKLGDQKDKDLSEARLNLERLQKELEEFRELNDTMRGENNSLKKKVQSLQIDNEKIRVSQTQGVSSGVSDD